jgi:hypothetical protein
LSADADSDAGVGAEGESDGGPAGAAFGLGSGGGGGGGGGVGSGAAASSVAEDVEARLGFSVADRAAVGRIAEMLGVERRRAAEAFAVVEKDEEAAINFLLG